VAGAKRGAARPGLRRTLLSEFDLLGEGEGVLDLDAEILDGALDLGTVRRQMIWDTRG